MKKRAPASPHRWAVVRVGLYCALGGHRVGPGTFVRYLRADPTGRASCEACLKAYGVERPQVPARELVVMGGDE